jgi:hypothetical protein
MREVSCSLNIYYAELLLPIIGIWQVRNLGDIQWHNNHAKFSENPTNISKDESEKHRQDCDVISILSFLKKEKKTKSRDYMKQIPLPAKWITSIKTDTWNMVLARDCSLRLFRWTIACSFVPALNQLTWWCSCNQWRILWHARCRSTVNSGNVDNRCYGNG